MNIPSREEIEAAVIRLSAGLCKYLWLQQNLHARDVSSDREFQRRFNGFYRVRRGIAWRKEFYSLMERSKTDGIAFARALRELSRSTGRLEASFASKLVATLDASKPVIDQFVLKHFGLPLPAEATPGREARVIEIYESLSQKYADLIQSPTGAMMTGGIQA